MKENRTFFLKAASAEEAVDTISAIYRINKTELKASADSPYSIAPRVIVEAGKTSTFSRRGRDAVAPYSITYEPVDSIAGVHPKTIAMDTAIEAWATVEVLQRTGENVVIRRSGLEIGWEELRDETAMCKPDR